MSQTRSIGIVDAHHHLWDLERYSYPWLAPGTPSIVGDTSAIRRSYTADDYRLDHGRYTIVGSVHLDGGFDPTDPVGETLFGDEVFRASGLPSAIVGHVALDASNAQHLIEQHLAASPLFRGVRHIVAWHKDPRLTYVDRPDLITDAAWRRGYGLLSRYGLSADMQIYPSQMRDAAKLAADFADVPMFINQAGMPDGLISGDLGPWKAGIVELAAQPNVAVKISGFGMLVPRWTVATIRPVVEHLIASFGSDRVMFGSNFPVDKLFRGFEQIFDAYFDCVSDLDDATITKLFADNAKRLYRVSTNTHTSPKVKK